MAFPRIGLSEPFSHALNVCLRQEMIALDGDMFFSTPYRGRDGDDAVLINVEFNRDVGTNTSLSANTEPPEQVIVGYRPALTLVDVDVNTVLVGGPKGLFLGSGNWSISLNYYNHLPVFILDPKRHTGRREGGVSSSRPRGSWRGWRHLSPRLHRG